ncbi:MAG: hypothetical protein K2L89_07215 [Muribaculaceae bacterium]|nr:hypothetical protein [Muribaculaceae bacterium]
MQGAKKSTNPFATPDFAFPKKVAANARPELDKALKQGNGLNALKAVMQIVVAENLISGDNAQSGAKLIDSVANKLSSPYSALGLLLEARLYRDVYSAKSYLYNNRSIPTEPVPADISEWSRDIFSNRVCDLTARSFELLSSGKDLSISSLGTLVTDSKEAAEAGLTVYDFMTIQAVGNLRPFSNGVNAEIPFFSGEGKGNKKTERNASILINTILSNNSSWHKAKGKSRDAAVMALYTLDNFLEEVTPERVNDLIKEYFDTPWCAPFLIRLSNFYSPSDNDKYKEVYSLIDKYLKARPDCSDSEALRGAMKNMEATYVNISLPMQTLPGKKSEGTAKFRNLDKFYIHAIKVDDSVLGENINMDLVANKKIAGSVCIDRKHKEEKPFYSTSTFDMVPLESGVYAIVVSTNDNLSGLIKNAYRNSRIPVMLVSRLSTITSCDDKKGGENQALYVVDGNNQSPVEGAKVTFTPSWNNKKWKTVTLTSDKEGMVKVPSGSYNVSIKKGNDIFKDNVYERGRYVNTKEVLDGSVFTDLSIYHPGDSIGFVTTVYTRLNQTLKAASGKEIRAILMDANYQKLDTIQLKTDSFGRANGKFRLPTDGLLGNWSVQISDDKNNITQTFFDVSEYKSPTFYVTTQGVEGEIELGTPIKIKGEVKSYSGMPIPGASIKYNVTFIPWYRYGRYAARNATYGGASTTDQDGSFIIELPTAALKDTPYQFGRYQLNVTATNEAGETQEGMPVSFALGKAYSIRSDIPVMICADGKETINSSVSVYDMLDHPVKKTVYYTLKSLPDSTVVASGNFESGKIPFDIKSLKSGKYTVLFSLSDNKGSDAEDGKGETGGEKSESTFIVWRKTDKTPPVETSLWLPEDKITVTSENITAGKVKVKVGTSYPDSYIFSEISDMKGVISREWLKVSNGMVEVAVKSPSDMERVKATFSGMHDLEGVQKSVMLIPEIQTKKLQIKVESFRDLLVPGAKENWKFSFSFNDKEMASIPVMAVMSNKALDAISPFQWGFNPYGSLYWGLAGEMNTQSLSNQSWSFSPDKNSESRIKDISFPEWNTYGYPLYSGREGMGSIRIRGTRNMAMMKSAATAEAAEVESDAVFYAVEQSQALAAGAPINGAMKEEAKDEALAENPVETGAVAPEQEVMREVECPLAFFMPSLVTDDNGMVNIDFTVPAFNGTWKLQLMGYTPDMRGAVLTKEAVASKAVMVQMNAPRFVRTGDQLNISATIYNNTSENAVLGGKIELFNPLTDEIYAVKDVEDINLAAMGSEVISIAWNVPATIEFLGIRVYGMSDNSRDGEQTVIPVYPSSTPVTESKNFYLSPGEKDYSVSIPAGREGEVVTLSYTDNPIWECLTALPSLISTDSNNALALSQALYGNATAAGLIEKYPKLREALSIFTDPKNAGDSTLVSNLQKNASLKIVALNNTPWVMNAEAETLRMAGLADYLDKGKSRNIIQESLKSLKKLQNGDGGWSWCDGMSSSEWISISVLRNLAMLNKNGYLPSDAKAMAQNGFAYVDREVVKDWKKIGAKKYSYISLLDYLYIRSFFTDIKITSDFETIRNRALIEIGKNWKKMGINDKATAAILLAGSGNRGIAQTILASLEEYSTSSKEKGIWFDNLSSGYNGRGKLLTTARVLEAYNDIEPSSAMVDGLRQWLLLSKQVQDWGGGSAAADVIQPILDSGSNWTSTNEVPEIYIGSERIVPDRIAALTGALTVSLTGRTGDVKIKRTSEGPAWGGIVSRYVAPIAEVKSEKTAELSVEKNLYVITAGSDGTTASAGKLSKGDRVRVTLTIKCDRDLQYVAVTDSRSAALEPADQVSGYTSTDGVWYYMEVRNSATNLFIPFLSKGTHLISYDCFVDRAGEYSFGIAQAQSQYAPVISAHSAGELITVPVKK